MGLKIGINGGLTINGGNLVIPSWTPLNPTDLVASVYSATQMDLTWVNNGLKTPEGNKVYISTDNITFTLKDTIALSTSYRVNGLTQDVLYYFYVTAYKGDKESGRSNIASDFSGIWYLAGGIDPANVLAAYNPIGAASKAASLVNLANPGTDDLTDTGDVSWNKILGWYGFSSTKYLNGPSYKNRTYSVIALCSNPKSDIYYGRLLSSEIDASGNYGMFIAPCGSVTTGYLRQTTQFISFPNKHQGVFGANQNAFFIDGVNAGNFTPAGTETTATLRIGCNRFGAGVNVFNGQAQGFVIYKTSITDAQMVAVQNRLLSSKYRFANRNFAALTRYSGNPIINYGPESWRSAAADVPYVDMANKIGSDYYAFTQVSQGGWNWLDLKLFKSSDLLAWNPVSNGPEISCVAGTWEDHWMLHPCTIKIGSLWFTYYTARDASQKGRLGVATSPDLINWTKSPLNPIFTAPSGNVDACSVILIGSTYYLYYYNVASEIGNSPQYATSPDGINWTYGGACWVTQLNDFDYARVALDICVKYNPKGLYEMIYTSGTYAAPFNQDSAYACSFDGVNWFKYQGFAFKASGVGYEAGFIGNPQLVYAPNTDGYFYYCATVQNAPTPLVNNVGMLAIMPEN